MSHNIRDLYLEDRILFGNESGRQNIQSAEMRFDRLTIAESEAMATDLKRFKVLEI